MAINFVPQEPKREPVSEAATHALEDLYNYLLTASWPVLIALIFGFFIVTNLLFAV